MAVVRVNCTIDERVVKGIDEFAEENCCNRSVAITMLCNRAIKDMKMQEACLKLAGMVNDKGEMNVSVVGASDGK